VGLPVLAIRSSPPHLSLTSLFCCVDLFLTCLYCPKFMGKRIQLKVSGRYFTYSFSLYLIYISSDPFWWYLSQCAPLFAFPGPNLCPIPLDPVNKVNFTLSFFLAGPPPNCFPFSSHNTIVAILSLLLNQPLMASLFH